MRARRHFRPKEDAGRGAPFSPTKTRPSGPFSAYQARCRFTSLCRKSEAPADPDRVGEGVDLGDGGDAPFGSGFLARALDPARVAADQVVVDSRLQDALEEAVRLGDGRLGSGGAESFGPPLADTGSGDLVQVDVPKAGRM